MFFNWTLKTVSSSCKLPATKDAIGRIWNATTYFVGAMKTISACNHRLTAEFTLHNNMVLKSLDNIFSYDFFNFFCVRYREVFGNNLNSSPT